MKKKLNELTRPSLLAIIEEFNNTYVQCKDNQIEVFIKPEQSNAEKLSKNIKVFTIQQGGKAIQYAFHDIVNINKLLVYWWDYRDEKFWDCVYEAEVEKRNTLNISADELFRIILTGSIFCFEDYPGIWAEDFQFDDSEYKNIYTQSELTKLLSNYYKEVR